MIYRSVLIAIGFLCLVLVVVLIGQPDTRPWPATYGREGKAPLDMDVFSALLQDWMAPHPVESVNVVPFSHLRDRMDAQATYLITASRFEPDRAESGRLLEFVHRGGTLFLIADSFGGPLADTLGVAAAPFYRSVFQGADTLVVHLSSQPREGGFAVMPPSDRLPRSLFPRSLDSDPEASHSAVGYTDSHDGPLVTLLRVPWGGGEILLSNTPLAFSNVAMMHGEAADYAAAVAAYLPRQTVWWDRTQSPRGQATATPMRYVMEQPPLRAALYTMLFGIGLFVVFRGRRWQRLVPVTAALPSESLTFARTIGRLYYEHGDRHALLRKQQRMFLSRLRTHMRDATLDLTEESAERIAFLGGVAPERVRRVFRRLKEAESKPRLSASEIVDLDQEILDLYRDLGILTENHNS